MNATYWIQHFGLKDLEPKATQNPQKTNSRTLVFSCRRFFILKFSTESHSLIARGQLLQTLGTATANPWPQKVLYQVRGTLRRPRSSLHRE